MLAVYRLIACFAAPLALAYLRWRAPGPPGLRALWRERLGLVPHCQPPVVWLHASSVGEINAAQALITALIERNADLQLVVSTFTATGRARASQLFGQSITTTFAPLDTPGSVRRWLNRIQPALGIIVETEIWPELFVQCGRRNIPLMLVNARLAPAAMQQYMRYRRLFGPALEAVDLAICQGDDDAERFRRLGLADERIRVAGNLKFDMPIPDNIGSQTQALRQRWGDRPVWVAGSTRKGEEEVIIAAHQHLIKTRSDALLVLAPRHPERCDDIRQLLDQAGLQHQTIDEQIEAETAVVLVNGLGLLLPCYAASPAAFVGGSLVDIGGHNLLEPAAFGKVVIAGPHLHQQSEMAAALTSGQALIQVENDADLARAIGNTWDDPQMALERGRAALQVVENGRGSLRRTLRLMESLLPTGQSRITSAATD